MNNFSPGKDGKLAAIWSHFLFFGIIIAYFINSEKKDDFGGFYIRQNVGLFCLFLLLGTLVGMTPNDYAAYGFYLFIFIMWLYSFLGALQNKYHLLPILGEYFQKWFIKK